MHTQNSIIYYGGNRKDVEYIAEFPPYSDIVPPFALVIKTIGSINRTTLVISSQEIKLFRVLNFECEKETNSFNTLFAAIYVITHEEVFGRCLTRISNKIKETK